MGDKLPPRLLAQARVIARGNRIRDVRRLVARYGGRPSKWIKKSSPTLELDGERFEYHWYEYPQPGRFEMIVKLKRPSSRYRDLSTRQPYVVIGIEADDLRVLNDAGRPYLYPPRLFVVIDRREPSDWVTEIGEGGERYAYPRPLNKPGFFEDFFDDKSRAVGTFWRVVNRRLAAANEVA